ncbi:MAG: hypothetical protein K2M84_02810 [Anaeroplasmataceae bacterium]|nr:hypothetical protein [Anaeroplasmataceae bacterium]
METNTNAKNESVAITEEEFKRFLSATGEEQWKLLLAHAEKNKKIIQIRRTKKMEQNQTKNYEEISKQFSEFCHTKGLVAKFKLAFANMAESTRKQREADKAQLEEVKRQSAENNPEFTEFLHTKGFKAKVRLVIENIKKGAKEAPAKTAATVDRISAQTKANIAKTKGYTSNTKSVSLEGYSTEDLTREFNAFLKEKGLDNYIVEITEENND